MVLEIIREKDQADFRGVRNDFSSRMGGGSIEVCFLHEYSANLPVGWAVGGSPRVSHVTCKLLLKSDVLCCQKSESGCKGEFSWTPRWCFSNCLLKPHSCSAEFI